MRWGGGKNCPRGLNFPLYRRVNESTNLELFIARIANENSAADPAYSLEKPTETVKLPSDFKC